jgi:nucleotide-binding universal stress UspA family protein
MGQMMKEKPQVIVVGVDETEAGRYVLEEALRIAAKFKRAQVHVVHVVKAFGQLVLMDGATYGAQTLSISEAEDKLSEYVGATISAMSEELGGSPAERVVTDLGFEPASIEIPRLADEVEADLVVVGTHDHSGVSRLWHALTSEHVMRRCSCSVLVVRDPAQMYPAPEFAHACPKCIEMRQATAGATLFCAQHSEKHMGEEGRHTYHFRSRPLS